MPSSAPSTARKSTPTSTTRSPSPASCWVRPATPSAAAATSTRRYFEWLFPFTSTFDITIAGRYDKYSDYGNDFSPKIAARWQPLDNLTFRASYGEGFRAPTLDILTQQAAFSADPVTDPSTCVVFGGSPATCANTEIQVDATVIANGAT